MFSARTDRPLEVAFPKWGLCVLESHHGPHFRMAPTRHDFLKILYVLEGKGAVQRDEQGRGTPLEKGDLVVVPARSVHALRDDPDHPLALTVLCVHPRALGALPETPPELERFGVLRNYALAREADRLLRQLFFEQSLARPACAGMMTGLAFQLLASISRAHLHAARRDAPAGPPGSVEARVQAHIHELDGRFFENEKIDNVAERLGMSRRSFTRLFRRITGRSWLKYVHDLRLRHAKRLLQSDDRTTLWIAFECGFEDVSTFYRVFRAAEGVTPLEWRKAHVRRRPTPGVALATPGRDKPRRPRR